MKTNFTKILKSSLMILFLCLGLSSWGQTETAIYTVTSTSAVSISGTSPIGSIASYSQTYNTAKQITSGNSATLTLNGYQGHKITNIVLEMRSNASAGAGTLSVVAGTTSIASVSPTAAFNSSSWYGGYSTTYVNVSKNAIPYEIDAGESVVIQIAATTNSLYIQKYTITYEAATPPTQVATPNISFSGTAVATDTYLNSTDVTLATSTSGATIYYTTDGNDPTTSSTIYETPFSITSTTVIKAFAVADGLDDSEILTKNITIVNAPENDLCQNAIPLTVNASATNGTLQYATVSGNPFSNSKDVWYTISPTWDAPHTITLSGFSGDADLYLFDQLNSCPTTTSTIASSATTSSTETITHNLVSSKTYYVRIIAYNVAAESDFNISVTSTEPLPTITSSTPTAMTAVLGGNLVTQNITIGGTNLEGDITAVLSDNTHFSVSPSQFSFTGGTLVVTYQPTTLGTHTATVTLSSTGAQDVIINLNGTATLAAPIAIAQPIYTTSNSFVANWNPVPGAETYEIDVYTIEETMGGFATDLFISEYLEGSSNNKYIEIFNGTGEVVNLSDYEVRLFANGGSSASNIQNLGALQSTLANGSTIVLRNSGSVLSLPSGVTTYSSTVCNFNGDDAIGLYNNDNLIDVFGRIGNDPGTAWTGSGGYTTVDKTLRRKSSVTEGVSTSPSGTGEEAFITLTTEWDLYDINTVDGLGSHDFDGGITSTVVYILENENVGNVTSLQVTGLDADTTYYYVVRAVAGSETTENSNEIEVTTQVSLCTSTVTYSSSTWSGTADETTKVIIDDIYILESDLEVCELEITENGSILIEEGLTLTVNGIIVNNGEFIVESGANLIQIEDVENVGEIVVYRNSSPMKRLDYTVWSSPVSGQGLQSFSPLTLANRIYTYSNGFVVATGDFEEGLGYSFRAPNNYHATNTQVYEGAFTGVPHNGEVVNSVSGGTFHLAGNPYPSAIDVDMFLASSLNPDVDALYFWTNVYPYNSETGTYSGNNYATYSLAGPVSSPTSEVPNGFIEVGQGFFVGVSGDTDITFNNDLRTSEQGVFFRTMNADKHRIWLNLSIDSIMLNQTMIAYMEGATEGVDSKIDSKMFGYEGSSLYNLIGDSSVEYVIQGRSLPFVDTDVVSLGFKASEAGSYTISLANFDGLFSEGQVVYIKDNYTGTEQSLTEGSYTFVSEVGTFNNRFEVVYRESSMSVTNPDLTNRWVVYSQGNGFQVEAQGFDMKQVEVYDMLGRVVYNSQAEGGSHTISNAGANGVLIVKVTTTDNQILTRKVAK